MTDVLGKRAAKRRGKSGGSGGGGIATGQPQVSGRPHRWRRTSHLSELATHQADDFTP